MATPTESPPAPTPIVDATALLTAALRLGAAHAGTAISTQHLALSELVRVYRAMPEGCELVLAAPVVKESRGG